MDNTATITVKEYDELREFKKKYKKNVVEYTHKAYYDNFVYQTEFMTENEAVLRVIESRDNDMESFRRELDAIKRPWKWRMFIGLCLGAAIVWIYYNG